MLDGIQGNLLRWGRLEKGLSMREVYRLGGPTPSYQSEVENGVKTRVTTRVLSAWVQVLGVTEEFALGRIPQCRSDLRACQELISQLGLLQDADAVPSVVCSLAEVLKRLAASPRLPPAVLAFMLDLSVKDLTDYMAGKAKPDATVVKVISALTGQPVEALQLAGASASEYLNLLHRYLPAVRLAHQVGMTAQELQELILTRQYLTVLHSVRSGEKQLTGLAELLAASDVLLQNKKK